MDANNGALSFSGMQPWDCSRRTAFVGFSRALFVAGRAPAASVSPLLVTVLGTEGPCEGTSCQTDLVPAHLIPCSEFVVSRAC